MVTRSRNADRSYRPPGTAIKLVAAVSYHLTLARASINYRTSVQMLPLLTNRIIQEEKLEQEIHSNAKRNSWPVGEFAACSGCATAKSFSLIFITRSCDLTPLF